MTTRATSSGTVRASRRSRAGERAGTAKKRTHRTFKHDDTVRQVRVDLAAAFRMAARLGYQESIGGHFSVELPGATSRFILNPMGLFWSEITASKLIVVDHDGNKVSGEGQLEPTAFHIHAAIHRAHPHARCVIHVHTPYATALAVLDKARFEFVHQSGLRFFGKIAYDDAFNGLVTDKDEGARLARALGDSRVMFLANHGQIIVGRSVAEAYQYTYALERNCMYIALARMHGMALRRVPDAVCRSTQEALEHDPLGADVLFAGVKRILEREEPGYAD
jgi:ribulose-5-phosphate 4-epimerase/fuculose-1-phosphate aldolase